MATAIKAPDARYLHTSSTALIHVSWLEWTGWSRRNEASRTRTWQKSTHSCLIDAASHTRAATEKPTAGTSRTMPHEINALPFATQNQHDPRQRRASHLQLDTGSETERGAGMHQVERAGRVKRHDTAVHANRHAIPSVMCHCLKKCAPHPYPWSRLGAAFSSRAQSERRCAHVAVVFSARRIELSWRWLCSWRTKVVTSRMKASVSRQNAATLMPPR
eukprot:865371-Rhodomonas_salina.1